MTTPQLTVKVKKATGDTMTITDAAAYSILLQLARIFRSAGQQLSIRSGQAIRATSAGQQVAEYTPNVFVKTTTDGGMTLHVREGDCGCMYKRFVQQGGSHGPT